MEEVRRDEDGELCGYVAHSSDGWDALTVFGGLLGRYEQRSDAETQVIETGLSSLAERWTLRNDAADKEEIVCIQEANPSSVTVARDY